MQAYMNDASMKAFVLRLLHEEHQGLPPIKWPDDPASTGVDYEAQLGIPLTVAVVAHAIWRGAGPAYAQPWPARFFDTIQPGQDFATVGARWVDWLCTSRSFPGMMDTAWDAMGERLLSLLAAARRSAAHTIAEGGGTREGRRETTTLPGATVVADTSPCGDACTAAATTPSRENPLR